MRLDLDSGDDGFHITAVIEQRSEARPALLAHAVAFVEDHDAAAQHRGHQRRSDVAQPRFALDHRRDQQILGPRIDRGLHDVDFAIQAFGGRIGQRGFADARLAQQARIHRQILRIDHQPGRQQLAHHFFLPHPGNRQLVGVGQMQRNAFDLNDHIASM